MFEREYRELSVVPRWTIIRTIQKQNVAEHSYYVTLYAGQIADLIGWQGSRSTLLDYALRHDLEETYMSDIPGPSKRAVAGDRRRYDEHCRTENIKRFGDDYAARLAYPSDRCIAVYVKLTKEIKAIIKVADLLDECFFLCLDQQMGNHGLQLVFEASMKRLCDAIAALPEGKQSKSELERNLMEAVYEHRNAQSTIPTG